MRLNLNSMKMGARVGHKYQEGSVEIQHVSLTNVFKHKVSEFVFVVFFAPDEGILIPKARVQIHLLDLRVVFQLSTSSYLCPTPAPIFMESLYIIYNI